KRARLQRLLQEHEASEKVADQGVKFGSSVPTVTLSEQLRNWLSLDEYDRQLQAAAQQASAHARALLDQHKALESQLPTEPGGAVSVERLRRLSEQHKTLTGLDQRAQDTNQLLTVYQRWIALVEYRRRSILHLLLRSLAMIFGILLAAVLLNGAIRLGF